MLENKKPIAIHLASTRAESTRTRPGRRQGPILCILTPYASPGIHHDCN